MVDVEVRCPSCGKWGKIGIKEEILNSSQRGLVAINISQDQFCDHGFIVYVDKNLIVRDSIITDFQLDLPEIELSQPKADSVIPPSEILDPNIVKTSIPPLILAYILKAYLMQKPLLFISDNEKVRIHLKNLFDFISKNTFKAKFGAEDPQFYKNNKKIFKKYLVLKADDVIKDKEKILNPKKIKIESKIIEKFYEEDDKKSSLIIIKNEIQKAHEISKTIHEHIKSSDENGKLFPKQISSYLENQYKQKFDNFYVRFIIQIIRDCFGFNFIKNLSFGEVSIWFWYLN